MNLMKSTKLQSHLLNNLAANVERRYTFCFSTFQSYSMNILAIVMERDSWIIITYTFGLTKMKFSKELRKVCCREWFWQLNGCKLTKHESRVEYRRTVLSGRVNLKNQIWKQKCFHSGPILAMEISFGVERGYPTQNGDRTFTASLI